MQSIWRKTTHVSEKRNLEGNISVQNVVIGAGMAGLLTAYFLWKKGLEVVVLEADRIAGGQTKNTTAKITSQHGLCYHNMIKKAGFERAKGYAVANEAAINAYEEIIREEGISCQFERLPSFLYATSEAGKNLLKKEADAARKLGIDASFSHHCGNTLSAFEHTGILFCQTASGAKLCTCACRGKSPDEAFCHVLWHR